MWVETKPAATLTGTGSPQSIPGYANVISWSPGGTSKPFYFDPPFLSEAAIWMKLSEDSRQQLDRAAPGSPDSARPEIHLSMLEHLA